MEIKLTEIKLSKEYLDELLDYVGRTMVGKIMKRYEIIDNKEILKNLIKEVIISRYVISFVIKRNIIRLGALK